MDRTGQKNIKKVYKILKKRNLIAENLEKEYNKRQNTGEIYGLFIMEVQQ